MALYLSKSDPLKLTTLALSQPNVAATDRHVELLKRRADTLRIQPVNNCWFIDPASALAADRLQWGQIPPGGGCDVETFAAEASISRASLYRTYGHLKTEFEHCLDRMRRDR